MYNTIKEHTTHNKQLQPLLGWQQMPTTGAMEVTEPTAASAGGGQRQMLRPRPRRRTCTTLSYACGSASMGGGGWYLCHASFLLDLMERQHLLSPSVAMSLSSSWSADNGGGKATGQARCYALVLDGHCRLRRGSGPRFVKFSNGPNTNSECSNLLN